MEATVGTQVLAFFTTGAALLIICESGMRGLGKQVRFTSSPFSFISGYPMAHPNKFEGWFHLQKPSHLREKLERDYQRVLKEPLSSDAAFDFFVTGDHIVDWWFPGDKTRREALRTGEPIRNVAYHISSGAKHFKATFKHHDSVEGSGVGKTFEDGVYEPGVFGDFLTVDPTQRMPLHWDFPRPKES